MSTKVIYITNKDTGSIRQFLDKKTRVDSSRVWISIRMKELEEDMRALSPAFSRSEIVDLLVTEIINMKEKPPRELELDRFLNIPGVTVPVIRLPNPDLSDSSIERILEEHTFVRLEVSF